MKFNFNAKIITAIVISILCIVAIIVVLVIFKKPQEKQFKMDWLWYNNPNYVNLGTDCKGIKLKNNVGEFDEIQKNLKDVQETLINTTLSFKKDGEYISVKDSNGKDFFYESDVLIFTGSPYDTIPNDDKRLLVKFYTFDDPSSELYQNPVSFEDLKVGVKYSIQFTPDYNKIFYPFLHLGDIGCRIRLNDNINGKDNTFATPPLIVQLKDTK